MSPPFDSKKHFKDIAALYRVDEDLCLDRLFPAARLAPAQRENARKRATLWIEEIRRTHKPSATVTDLLARFGLNSNEGLALMCLAEALLRIPDRATADALIRDKLSETHWDAALASDAPWTMNAAGWALSITGAVIDLDDPTKTSPGAAIGKLVSRLGQPVIREALCGAMQWLADQFVTGETIEKALERSRPAMEKGTRFSFDMLGEGARTAEDAAGYLDSYMRAIDTIGAFQAQHKFPRSSGISVKLSALHPRYEMAQRERVMREMVPSLTTLCERAAKNNTPVTIDAEETDRLQLSLEVIEWMLQHAKLGAWQGLGFAVQAYQKRAPAVIDFLVELARTHKRQFHIRLVKGAYWDSEIKRAQERGWDDFPVFTRKAGTDVSYLACAQRMLAAGDSIAPVFGTHNAMTVAHILEAAPDTSKIEFQKLHGMNDDLYRLMRDDGMHAAVYAPVGDHEVLLGYLVRRILENGANSSFVHRQLDKSVSVAQLTADPLDELRAQPSLRHPYVKRAPDLYAPGRRNSAGLDLADPYVTDPLLVEIGKVPYPPAPNEFDGDIDAVFRAARHGYDEWSKEPVETRAACLEKLADFMERDSAILMAILVREGGKTIPDALAEVREAVDFCRYYAMRAREDFRIIELPGPVGEKNTMRLVGRGVFVCISPWNFPLAIFLGQISAALVSGNAVLAKPASQTRRIAAYMENLIHKAGVPMDVFQLIIGGGKLGGAFVAHPNVAGVSFTGSTSVAQDINRSLAAKDGPIVPLIAETGGQNAMIVDSSALPEQVVDDVITSAFRSAGQRCSALRVLCLPMPTADKILKMLKGAMRELRIGDPVKLETDVGPVIDAAAKHFLLQHVERLSREAKEIYTVEINHLRKSNGVLPPLRGELEGGSRRNTDGGLNATSPHPASPLKGEEHHGSQWHFVAPQAWEISSIEWLEGEVFGPILHVVRYRPDKLGTMIAQINATGFGLTFGLHSRIEGTVRRVEREANAGNFYVNRSMIGAVVGVQPFGGEGLSGTGPKAGGPHYLPRFALERVTSNNITAAGGNASLLMATSDPTV